MASASLPDWRDAGAYAWLLNAGRSAFAWEWLRRSEVYRLDWAANPAAFGLLAPVDWGLDARAARPIWAIAVDPAVLRCVVGGVGDALELGAIAGTTCVRGAGVEHWLVSDGLHSLRIDCVAGSLADGPVAVRWQLDGLVAAEPQLLALRRLIVVARTGRLGGGLFPPERKAGRWILALRVADALAAGASQFEIASVLFDVSGPRWRVGHASDRLRVQRLVRVSRDLARRPMSWWLG